MSEQKDLRLSLVDPLLQAKLLSLAAPPAAGEAHRIASLVKCLLEMNLVAQPDRGAIELAVLAIAVIQNPLRRRGGAKKKHSPLHWRRCGNDAAEILIEIAPRFDKAPVDSAARMLRELHRAGPLAEDTRLLADALNLDEFGVIGLFKFAFAIEPQNHGIEDLIAGYDSRDQYGYWEARLKNFHFDAVRELARTRLEKARQVMTMLKSEIGDQSRS